jgi:hypothetical protein
MARMQTGSERVEFESVGVNCIRFCLDPVYARRCRVLGDHRRA